MESSLGRSEHFFIHFFSRKQNIPEWIIQISTTRLRSQDNTPKQLT